MSKTIMPVIIIFLIVTPIQGHFVFNEANTAFGCHQGESLTPNQIEMKRFIIEGGGYFLQAGSEIDKLLSCVEFSELSGLNFGRLQKTLDAAIDNMEKARENYYQLKILTAVTPYNQDMISRLIEFNYDGFQVENGLIPTVFERVKRFLVPGNLRGIYSEFYNNTGQILTALYTLKKDLDAGNFPNISILWSLNQKFSETKLLGQYTSMVFYAIR